MSLKPFIQLTLLAVGLSFLSAPPARAFPGGERFKLRPLDPQPGRFGCAVAMSESLAVIGALLHGPGGAAYVFDVGSGSQVAKMLPGEVEPGSWFGSSVDIDGENVIVGAPNAPDDGSRAGSAYLIDASSGALLHKLLPEDGAADNGFGWSVAICGSFALVGAPKDDEVGTNSGSAYLFDVASGRQLAKLVSSDLAAQDWFGVSVALDGTTAIVGAEYSTTTALFAGSAYLFDVTTGAQTAKLVAADPGFADSFGGAVALSGTTAVVGAWRDDHAGMTSAGSAYLFDTTTGAQTAKLVASDGAAQDFFGGSVSIDGTRVLIGAERNDDQGDASGAAYLFDTTTAYQVAKLLPEEASSYDWFGEAVAVSGIGGIVGASGHDLSTMNVGAAYLFNLTVGTATPYCFGSGPEVGCPCSNQGSPNGGCANAVFTDGARLVSSGCPDVESDSFVLEVTRSTPGQPGMFFQGDEREGGGLGIPFGDGLRCAGGNVLRLEVAVADSSGAVSTSSLISARAEISAGDVKRYQWRYRDNGASPCGNAFNLSNGMEVVWGL